MSTSIAKQQIMKARQPKVIDMEQIEYINKSHAIYLLLKKYPGLTKSEIIKGLVHDKSDITEKDIDNAIYRFRDAGYIQAQIGKGKDQPTVFVVNPDMEYSPRAAKAALKKVAPNDKKAMKSIRRMTRIKPELKVVPTVTQEELPLEKSDATPPVTVQTSPEPVQHTNANPAAPKKITGKPGKFEFIQGLAAIDPNSPHFGETARELAKQTGQEVKEGEPLAVVFFQFPNGQTPTLSLADTFKLYKELHNAFGKK